MNKIRFIFVLLPLLVINLCLWPTKGQAANSSALAHEVVLPIPQAQADDPVAQCAEGVELFFDGQYAKALPLLEAGFAGREGAIFANPDDKGQCALVLGILRVRRANLDGALDAYQVALEIFQEIGYQEREVITLNNIGMVYRIQGSYDEAHQILEQALEITRQIDYYFEATILGSIGQVYHEQGELELALEYYDQALESHDEVDNRVGKAIILNHKGLVYSDQGKYEEAHQLLGQALQIAREEKDDLEEATALNNMGLVYQSQGELDSALEKLEQAQPIFRELYNCFREQETLRAIGTIYESQGDEQKAQEYEQQALMACQQEPTEASPTPHAPPDESEQSTVATLTAGAPATPHAPPDESEESTAAPTPEAPRAEAPPIQEAREASLGENRGEVPVDGSQVWIYEGQAGEVLTIRAEADKPVNESLDRTGLLDMVLLVYAPDGTILAKADDIKPGMVTDALIEGLALPTDGTYNIEILGLQKKGGGTYTLTLEAAHGTPPEATPTVESSWPVLTIENQLEQPICFVYIWPTLSDELGDEWLGTTEFLLPNEQRQWALPPDIYKILLTDCDGNTLETVLDFEVTDSSYLLVPVTIDGPVAQCAEGVQLYLNGQHDEALPLLEAGFAGRESVTFTDPDNEGLCARYLGILRQNMENLDGALEAYQVALNIFRASGNREFEGIILTAIGQVYLFQQDYDKALDSFQQVLALHHDANVDDPFNEGNALMSIAKIYQSQGKLDLALENLQQALSRYREGEVLFGEGGALMAIGTVYSLQGEDDQALEHLEQALPIFRELDDCSAQGTILRLMGSIYERKGDKEKAQEYEKQGLSIRCEDSNPVAQCGQGMQLFRDKQFSEALPLLEDGFAGRESLTFTDLDLKGQCALTLGVLRQLFGDNLGALEAYQAAKKYAEESQNREVLQTALDGIGTVYQMLGGYENALETLEQALQVARDEEDPTGQTSILNSIAAVYMSQGRYSEALGIFEEALQISQENKDRIGEATTLNNIGLVYQSQSRYLEALGYYFDALQIHREEENRIGEASTLNNIGVVYRELGNYEKAAESFQEALEIYRELEYRAAEGVALNNLGAIYESQGKLDLAEEYYEQALQILRQVEDRYNERTVLDHIGGIYLSLGDYERALDRYEQALAIAREIGDTAGEASTLNNMSSVYRSRGELDWALNHLEQALELTRALGDQKWEAIALSNIGMAYYEQERYEEAVGELKSSIEIFEKIRGDIKVDQFKSSFISEQVSLYRFLISLLVQQERPEEAFSYVLRAKARTFLDQLGNEPINFRAGMDADLLAEEQKLRTEINEQRQELVTLHNGPREEWDKEAITSVKDKLEELESQYSDLLLEIKVQSPEVATLISVDVPTLAEVQELLEPNVTLIEYFLTDENILIFLITHNSFEIVQSPVERETLVNDIKYFRSTLGQADNQELFKGKSQELYELLMAPIAEKLTANVIIAPHSDLHYLPFGALSDGESYLIDHYTLTTVPSASILPFLKDKRKPESGNLLALGNPTTLADLKSLPNAEEEAKGIASMYGTDALIGTAATEEVVRKESQQAEFIHLAAHGTYNQYNPSFSTVHLAASGDYDGRLEVHEIYGLDLTQATNLVVLSACETILPEIQTDIGAISGGDEIIALNRALIYAGTPTVIATLWQVDDQATGLLMQHFYSHLQAGQSKAQALRLAQQDMLADEEHAHPYYWAGFVLTGDGGESSEVPPPPTPLWNWWLIGGGLLIALMALIAAGVWFKRRQSPR